MMGTSFRPRLLGGAVDLAPVMGAISQAKADAMAKAAEAEAKAIAAEKRAENAQAMARRRDEAVDAQQVLIDAQAARFTTVEELAANYLQALEASRADRKQLNDRAGVLEHDCLALALRVKALEDARVEFDRQTKTLPALTLLASTTEQAFTWKKPFTDTIYQLRPIIIQGGLNLSSVTITEKTGTKTAAGVTLVVKAVGVAISAGAILDVIAWREAIG